MSFIQKILPRYYITKLFGWLGDCETKWFKNFFIRRFIKFYKVDLSEALITNPKNFKSFNAFFSRKLKAHARKIDLELNSVISPVDGFIYAFGQITKKPMFKAKGFEFSLEDLVVSPTIAESVKQGHFFCLYLSPKDYHRVHMPVSGKLLEMIYVPGDFYSVSPSIINKIPAIFAKNERVICLFETDFGPMAYIMIGAMNVASIHTVWAGAINQLRKGKIIITSYQNEELYFKKGEELGHFQMGSTVMVLLGNPAIQYAEINVGDHCLMGQKIGMIRS